MKNTIMNKGFLAVLIGAVLITPGFAFANHDGDNDPDTVVTNLNTLFFGDPDGYDREVSYTSWRGGEPIVRTIGATNISRSRATLQAYYSSDGTDYNMKDAPKLYIQYGTDRDMEETTEAITQSKGSRTTSFQLSGLESDETYYFRAILIFSDEVARGERMSFKTLDDGESRVTQEISDDDHNAIENLNTLFFGNPNGLQEENTYHSTNYSSNSETHYSSNSGTTYQPSPTYTAPKPASASKPKTSSIPKKAEASSDFKNQASIFGVSSLGAGFFPQTLLGWLLIIAVITGMVWAIRKLAAK